MSRGHQSTRNSIKNDPTSAVRVALIGAAATVLGAALTALANLLVPLIEHESTTPAAGYSAAGPAIDASRIRRRRWCTDT
jgi:hypothetical protein